MKKLGSCTLPGQLSMDNHICLIGGQIFYFIVHIFFQLSTCFSNCPDPKKRGKKKKCESNKKVFSPKYNLHKKLNR
ncbi:hypothetical protein BpHYR1_012717 [Brachionus plicatilis]|uniref:Uncharacterized protein n=1 Tax=Brachionus plicatilis TaxID=10195 RepID=A0A3M7Q9Z5_BRAPC|nr:hypothetical protein BpHYR1_012717 [Brachionus plicatilis]